MKDGGGIYVNGYTNDKYVHARVSSCICSSANTIFRTFVFKLHHRFLQLNWSRLPSHNTVGWLVGWWFVPDACG
jgi:hypothetical protein